VPHPLVGLLQGSSHSNLKEDSIFSWVRGHHYQSKRVVIELAIVYSRLWKFSAGTLEKLPTYLGVESGAHSNVQRSAKERKMDDNLVGLVAVTLFFGVPLAAMYIYYRVRKLRTEERLAAIARGANVAMEPDLSEAAQSRRWGILLVAISLGYRHDGTDHARESRSLEGGSGWFCSPGRGHRIPVDFALIRRDLKSAN
jgi:hypothetical protein